MSLIMKSARISQKLWNLPHSVVESPWQWNPVSTVEIISLSKQSKSEPLCKCRNFLRDERALSLLTVSPIRSAKCERRGRCPSCSGARLVGTPVGYTPPRAHERWVIFSTPGTGSGRWRRMPLPSQAGREIWWRAETFNFRRNVKQECF